MTVRADLIRAIQRPARPVRPGIVLHVAVLVATLLVCLVLPRSGQGVLLVPVLPQPAAVLPSDIGGQGLSLLGRGPLPGSLLVRPAGPFPLMSFLRHGVLPIAVPPTFCGRDGSGRTGPRPNPSPEARTPWMN